MRLFVDGRWFSQPGQGVATYLLGLHEQLLARRRQGANDGIDLVLGVERAADVPAPLRAPEVEIVELGPMPFGARLLSLPAILRSLRIDVAHFQYSCPLKKLGVRHVVTIHDVLFLRLRGQSSLSYRLPRRLFFGLAARRADAVLTVSEQSAADIHACLGVSRPIDIVYNGASASLRTVAPVPLPSLSGRQFLLTVGRVEPRKNYRRLIASFLASQARANGGKLVVAGFCAPEFHAEEAALRAAGPDVLWLDRVSDGELNWLYEHARAFVYPSLGEGFGIPVLEALRAGLPAAIADTYPLADVKPLCQQFDPLDCRAMTEAIDTVAAAPAPAVPDSLWARYSWPAMAERYAGILHRVASEPIR